MGIKIIVPALGHEIISDHFRPIHRSRLSAEDYVWSAYSGVGHYIFEQCRYLSEEIKRVKNTWQHILRFFGVCPYGDLPCESGFWEKCIYCYEKI